MSSSLPVLLPVAFGIVAVVVIVLGVVAEQRRRERLMRDCLARGWTYAAADPALVDRWSGEPFGQGDSRQARNVITGIAHGHPFTAFDYSYETHSTDSKGHRSTTTHRFAVCALGLPAPLPAMEVLPESVLSRVAGAVGLGQDLELESEDFNRRFRVRAGDPKFACDVLHPRTMEYLVAADPPAWRIDGADMLAWSSGRIATMGVLAATSMLVRVADGIPPFVWKDRGYDPRS